jgi:hypothetical protein
MDATKNAVYYIIPKGATQEEACSWQELESACRAGRLSPDTLIYLPGKDVWEKAIYTELRRYFRSKDEARDDPAIGEDDADDAMDDAMEARRDAYEEACREARSKPDSAETHLHAARAAMAMQDREAAGEHCRNAIALHPFHPKIAGEVKRVLGPAGAAKLQFLERPEPFWEDVLTLVMFPLRSGIAAFVIPAAAVTILALIPFLRPVAVVVCYLWATATILQTASGDCRPFDFRRILEGYDIKTLKRLIIGAAVIAELYLPFIIVAELLILTGASERSNVVQFIQHSEAMIVFLWVAGVLYLPAAFAIVASPDAEWKKSLNVQDAFKAIFAMEMEYAATLIALFIPVTIWGAGRLFLGSVPVAGIVLPVAMGLYGLSIAGYMIGLLSARYRHEWENGTACRRESGPLAIQ